MSEPVAERIASTVRTRMAAYASAYRSTQVATWQPKDLTIHVFQNEIVRNEAMGCPGNPPATAWDMTLTVAGIIKPSSTSTIAVDTLKNRFWAEIIKAATNADQWHTWGGLAYDTTISDVMDYTADDGSASGVMVQMLIRFRTSELDPYGVRA